MERGGDGERGNSQSIVKAVVTGINAYGSPEDFVTNAQMSAVVSPEAADTTHTSSNRRYCSSTSQHNAQHDAQCLQSVSGAAVLSMRAVCVLVGVLQ